MEPEITIGRVVHFHTNQPDQGAPEAAIVAYVHSPSMVNLSVIDHNGNHRAVTSVRFGGADQPGMYAVYPARV